MKKKTSSLLKKIRKNQDFEILPNGKVRNYEKIRVFIAFSLVDPLQTHGTRHKTRRKGAGGIFKRKILKFPGNYWDFVDFLRKIENRAKATKSQRIRSSTQGNTRLFWWITRKTGIFHGFY